MMVFNDTVLLRRHSLYLVWVGVFYGISNYFATKKRGMPLYWFMTWEDISVSSGIVALITAVFVTLFYLLALLDELITHRKSGRQAAVSSVSNKEGGKQVKEAADTKGQQQKK